MRWRVRPALHGTTQRGGGAIVGDLGSGSKERLLAYPRNSRLFAVSATLVCMWSRRWHRLLCFFGIRNDFDWAPPGLGPEVPHPYYAEDALQCCRHCGGGKLHRIHEPPYSAQRQADIEALERARVKHAYVERENGVVRDVQPGSRWGAV